MELPSDKHSQPSLPLETGIEDRDLRIEMFAICEAATNQNGRLTVVGAFEALSLPCVPYVLPTITVAIRLRFWPGEEGRAAVRIVVTDPDGQAISQVMEGQGKNPAFSSERSQASNIIVQIHELQIPEAGEYSVDFYLNDQLEGRLPLCVVCPSQHPGE